MRFVSHFVVYVLYLLVACFLLHYIRSDFWVLIQVRLCWIAQGIRVFSPSRATECS